MKNEHFRRVLSVGTMIGAFCSVGVLSAQSFVPEQQYPYDPQFHTQPPPPPQSNYLECMQAAEARREDTFVQLFAWQYDQLLEARRRQAQGRIDAWEIEDNRDRRDRLREVDRAFRDARDDIGEEFDDIEDEMQNRYRDDRRECDRIRREESSASRSRSSRSGRSSSRSSYWWDHSASSSSRWWEPHSSRSSSFREPYFDEFNPSSYGAQGATRATDGSGHAPFGPLPPSICGDPWTTPGLGLIGDEIPLRVCIL